MSFFSRKKESAPQGNEPAGLIVGLGNPGPRYAQTRHNMGFMAVERLLARLEADPSTYPEELPQGKKFQSILWRARFPQSGRTWLIMTPLTYMNLSGEAVQPLMAWYKLTPDKLLVVHDELDIPPGRIMLKSGGGLAGHNGLKSIAQRLGSQDFHRLRLGIGRPADKDHLVAYVTERASPGEIPMLEDALDQAPEAIFLFDKDGAPRAATTINKKPTA